jgi:hypothetical protein
MLLCPLSVPSLYPPKVLSPCKDILCECVRKCGEERRPVVPKKFYNYPSYTRAFEVQPGRWGCTLCRSESCRIVLVTGHGTLLALN